MNAALTLRGAQFSSLNMVRGEATGVQVGAVNVGGEVKGAQIGVVNVARKAEGLQIGVVNLAEDLSGMPIGVLNYSHTGILETTTWADGTGMAYLTFSSGSRWWYTSYTFGYNPTLASSPFAFGGGVGGRIRGKRVYADVDAQAFGILTETYTRDPVTDDRPYNILSTLRASVGLKVGSHLSLVGGASANVLYKGDHPALISPKGPLEREVGDKVLMWPGFFAGIRLGR